jgi:hypothetical protein
LGEAEWTATQTVHFAASVALECWCATNAIADQIVSNKHTKATRFEIDRITGTPLARCLNLYQIGSQRNESGLHRNGHALQRFRSTGNHQACNNPPTITAVVSTEHTGLMFCLFLNTECHQQEGRTAVPQRVVG